MTKSLNKFQIGSRDVTELLRLFERNLIHVVVDGGWGVDALLGHQTRPHEDLDIAVQHKDVSRLRRLLQARGYQELPQPDSTDFNFGLGNSKCHKVDVHSYTFNARGENVYGIEYPSDSLTGSGLINGHPVQCISAEWAVKFHARYEPDENDFKDVQALCERFDISLPARFEKF